MEDKLLAENRIMASDKNNIEQKFAQLLEKFNNLSIEVCMYTYFDILKICTCNLIYMLQKLL